MYIHSTVSMGSSRNVQSRTAVISLNMPRLCLSHAWLVVVFSINLEGNADWVLILTALVYLSMSFYKWVTSLVLISQNHAHSYSITFSHNKSINYFYGFWKPTYFYNSLKNGIFDHSLTKTTTMKMFQYIPFTIKTYKKMFLRKPIFLNTIYILFNAHYHETL